MVSRNPRISLPHVLRIPLPVLAGLLALPGNAQQIAAPPPAPDLFANVAPRSYITAAEVVGRMKNAETAIKKGAQARAYVLLKTGSTVAVMSYRNKAAEHAEAHETEDELFVVLEGAGDLTMGGRLIDPTRKGTTLSSPKTEGGSVYRLAKGDMVLVPESTPHEVTRVDGRKLVLLSVHIPHPTP